MDSIPAPACLDDSHDEHSHTDSPDVGLWAGTLALQELRS